MNCERVTNYLEENFVATGFDLPDDIREHIDACDRCRAYFGELVSLGDILEPMADIALTPDEVIRLNADLDRSIDAAETSRSSYTSESRIFTLTRLAMAAAAVMLIMMVSLNGEFRSGSGLLQDIEELSIGSVESENLAGLFTNGDVEALPSLVEGDSASYITGQVQPGQADEIFETLTREELEWLMENLSVEI